MGMKLFYTGPLVNAEMLTVMLIKHDIAASYERDDPAADEEDLNALCKVFVPDADYDRAYGLFYTEREGEL